MRNIQHIGLIPDGARRWAKAHDVSLRDAYRLSVTRLHGFIDSALTLVDEVSVYMLSKENLGREESQLRVVLETEEFFLRTILPDLCKRHSAKVVHAGVKGCLPDTLVETIEWLGNETGRFESKKINLLLGYHPLDEIADACSRTGGQFGMEDLWVSSEVDVVIRTGGGRVMLSNFIPLQCGYSAFYVVDEFFNDFTVERFLDIYHDACSLGIKKGK